MTGDELRRHLRVAHHMDPVYVEVCPDAALPLEHQFHHEDGIDMEPHDHD